MKFLLLLLAPLALLVSVAYSTVIVPDSDTITGNTLTVAGGIATVDQPFDIEVSGTVAWTGDDVVVPVDLLVTLTPPTDCGPPQTVTLPRQLVTTLAFSTTFALTCSAIGPHVIGADLLLVVTSPFITDTNPDNNTASDSLTMVVEADP